MSLRLVLQAIASQRFELLGERFDLRLQPLQAGIFALFLLCLGLFRVGQTGFSSRP